MNDAEFLILKHFDEFKPKHFTNESLTSEMTSAQIGFGKSARYDWSDIIYRFKNNDPQYLQEVHHSTGTGLQPYSAANYKGDILTKVGVEILDYEINQRSSGMSFVEMGNKILEYCCERGVSKYFKINDLHRNLTIPKNKFNTVLYKMEKYGHVHVYNDIFSVVPSACLFINDGGYKHEQAPIEVHTHYHTNGDNSPIAGGDLIMGDAVKHLEMTNQNDASEKISRKTLTWTIVAALAALIAIIVSVLISHHVI